MTTPRSWPPHALPTAEQLAEWLAVCTDAERLAFAEHALRFEATAHACIMRDHEARIEQEIHRRTAEQKAVHDDLQEILLALGIGDHARPYSGHELVQRDILPAIWRQRYE